MRSTKLIVILIIALLGTASAEKISVEEIDYSVATSVIGEAPNMILLKFNLPELLEGSKIDLARLTITLNPDDSLNTAFPLQIFPYAEDWIASPGNMLLESPAINDSISYASLLRPDYGEEYYEGHGIVTFDITNMVSDWLSGGHENYGLIIMSSSSDHIRIPTTDFDSPGWGPEATVDIYFTGPEIQSP